MPGKSATQLKAEFPDKFENLPIIIVSADDGPETRRNALKLNAITLFRKPVDGPALLDAINWALETVKNDDSAGTPLERVVWGVVEVHGEKIPGLGAP